MNFKSLLNISLGLNSKAEAFGGYKLVQAKDFTVEYAWDCDEMAAAREDLIRDQHILECGDVLLLCKGKSFMAKCWDMDDKAVASSSYFILRIADKASLLPAYLMWFLNTAKTQDYLMSQSSGYTVKSITKATVAALEIPLCSVDVQKKLIDLDRLWQEEKLLHKELIVKKDAWLEQELFQKIKAAQ